MKIAFLLILSMLSYCLKLAILYSELRPDFLLPKDTEPICKQIMYQTKEQAFEEVLSEEIELIYDLSYSNILSKNIQLKIENTSIHYLNGFDSNNQLYLGNIIETEPDILLKFFVKLNIKNWAVFYFLSYYQDFKKIIDLSSYRVAIQDYSSILHLNFSATELKFTNISTVVLVLPPTAVISFLNLSPLKTFYYILLDFNDILLFPPFLLEDFSILRLSRTNSSSFLKLFAMFFAACPSEDFNKCLKDFQITDWKILQVKNNESKVIGSCEEDCYFTEISNKTLNLSSLNTKKEFKVSYDYSLFDPKNNSLNYLLAAYQGVQLGIIYTSNLSDIFQMTEKRLNLGGSIYNKSFVDAAFKKDSDFGYVMIAPCMSDLSVGVYSTLQNNSIHLPMIGYSNTASELSSTSNFPFYTRLCMPDPYVTLVLSMMFKYFNWKKIGILYVDNLFSTSLYLEFKELAAKHGILILNSNNSMLSSNLDEWRGADFDSVLHSLGKSNARIILVFCFTSQVVPILIRLYELGYYGEDYEFIAVGWLVNELLNPEPPYNETELSIIRNSLKGSLMFFPVSFVKDFGSQISSFYTSHYKSDPVGYTSFAFDASLSVFKNFEHLINIKADYENPEIFMRYFRKLKFIGTTGPVFFQQGNNDRFPMDHFILNTQILNGVWEVKKIGIFTPSSLQVFSFSENITWPGNSTPLDTPVFYYCGFSKDKARVNLNGLAFLIVVLILVFFCICLSVKLGWNKWKLADELDEIEGNSELTFMDIVNSLKVFIEFFQFIGSFPNSSVVLLIIGYIGNAISLDLESAYLLNPNVYWIIYYIVMSLASFAVVLRVLKIFGFEFTYFAVIGSMVGDVFFLSILSTLLNTYLCQYSYHLVYLYYDCTTFCWEYPHSMLLAFNSLILIVFSTIFVYEKPKYSSGFYPDQHICISPKHAYAKTLIQTVVVCLKKMHFLIGNLVFYIILLVIVSIYLVFLWQKPVYNLQVMNMWNFLIFVAVWYYCLLLFFCGIFETYQSKLWLILVLSGWGIIIAFGVVSMKIKKMRWPFKGGFRLTLLKFAFQIRNNKVENINKPQEEAPKVNNTSSTKYIESNEKENK